MILEKNNKGQGIIDKKYNAHIFEDVINSKNVTDNEVKDNSMNIVLCDAVKKMIGNFISRKTIAWLVIVAFTLVSYIQDSVHFEIIFEYGFVPITIAYIGADIGQRIINRNNIG